VDYKLMMMLFPSLPVLVSDTVAHIDLVHIL